MSTHRTTTEAEPTKHEEIILRGNDLILRSIFELNLGTQDSVLEGYLNRSVVESIQFTPTRIYPEDNLNGFIDHHFLGYRKGAFSIFTKVNFFPLYGAHLRPAKIIDAFRDCPESEYIAYCGRDLRHIAEDSLAAYELSQRDSIIWMDEEPLKWTPDPSLNVDLYIRNTWDTNSRILSSTPKVFLHSPSTNEVYSVRLPNVYDNAEICVGNDWNYATSTNPYKVINKPLVQANHGLKSIRDTPCNNDLYYPELTGLFARWDENGKQLPIVDPIPRRARCALSDDTIIQFAQWLKDPATQEILRD